MRALMHTNITRSVNAIKLKAEFIAWLKIVSCLPISNTIQTFLFQYIFSILKHSAPESSLIRSALTNSRHFRGQINCQKQKTQRNCEYFCVGKQKKFCSGRHQAKRHREKMSVIEFPNVKVEF